MPNRLYDLGNATLQAVNASFAAADIELPGRQYVHVGDVAWDCDQLVASFVGFGTPHTRLGASDLFTEVVAQGVPFTRSGSFDVLLVRKIKAVIGEEDDDLPSADLLDEDAEKLIMDGWVLFDGLQSAASAGSILEGGCQSIAVGPCLPEGPEGGFAGWRCSVSFVL